MPGLGDYLYGLLNPQEDNLAGAQYAGGDRGRSKGGVSPGLKQHWERVGKDLFRDVKPFASDAGPITPGPGAAQTLADARAASLPDQAGLGDIGREKMNEWLYPAPMPPDPRMLAYQNQQNEQLAQQAWNRQPPPQPQPPQPEGPSWADAFYKLISPALGGGGMAGPRY
jgi:hypothetical protein